MIRRPTVLLLLLAAGCGTRWEPIDVDGDGWSRQDGDCWDAIEGPAGFAGADIHPDATETFYDGLDQDCDGRDDYDQDGDGYVPAEMGGLATLGVASSGQLPAGDCWDVPVGPDGSALDGAAINPSASETYYDGVDQDCDGGSDYDADGDGHDAIDAGGGDCDDADGAINPDASETYYDGVDQDCDGNDCDADGDGYDADGGGLGVCASEDCDDTDPAVYPDESLPESWYNGIDENCDGNDGDADGDGYWVQDYEDLVVALGGEPMAVPVGYEDDCDDAAAGVYPGATEIWYDGVDQNCDTLSDYDADGDNHDSDAHGGDDCDDENILVNPEATETWYDGTDQDCDGGSDYDADRDGYDADTFGGDDCDDADPAFSPGVAEIYYDGIDQDCDGGSDYDADRDGHDGADWGGDDCNEADAGINPSASELWYDGVDQDCDGGSDYDADLDGYDSAAWGGDDCDDATASTNPDAAELWDIVDNDCNGLVDDIDVAFTAMGWLGGDAAGTWLGSRSSLSVGDVDDDGVPELLTGATEHDGQQGSVWVVDAGSPGSLRGSAAGYANPTVEGSQARGFMAVMGPYQADHTGDGVVDLVVGGTDAYDGSNAALALYSGGSAMLGVLTPSSATLTLSGADGAEPPTVLSHLDMDADGVAEILYADWSADGSWSYFNCPVYAVQPEGLSGSMSLASAATDYLFSWNDGQQLGRSMGGGDLDGDGYDDLVLGAPGYRDTSGDGFVGVYPGSDPLPSWSWSDFGDQAELVVTGLEGGSLGAGGAPQVCDLDADGTADLVVADPSSDAVYVFLTAAGLYGSATNVASADITISGTAGSLFGQSLLADDFTGDAVDDLYIGAPGSEDPSTPSATWNGAVYLFEGGALTSGSTLTTDQAGATLLADRACLLGAGLIGIDLDLDGTLDPIVAAPAWDDTGRVWLVRGR